MSAYIDPVYDGPVYADTVCVSPVYGAKVTFEVAKPPAFTKMFVVGSSELQPDQVAIARTLAGDLNAFNELVDRFQRVAYSVAYRMLQSREEASDAVQESFIKAYRALP